MLLSMTPAERIIEKCGGKARVAKLAGVHVTRVHRWTLPKEQGGTGGLVPTKRQQALLDNARKEGIDLSTADFFEVAQ